MSVASPTAMEHVMEWVRRAADFRVLAGKRDDLGCDLDEAEQARLDELGRFFARDAGRSGLPWEERQTRAPLSVAVKFGDFRGRARDISASGMFIVTGERVPIGAQLEVSINASGTDNTEGDDLVPYDEWRFSAEVVRLDTEGIGVRFVGIPLLLRVSHAA